MIWNSVPWKNHLSKTAKQISRWQAQKRWTEASLFRVEKEVFFGFYAIRKLLESKTKISFEARDTQTSVRVYKAKAKSADLMNWHKLEEIYDFSEGTQKPISLNDLCNSIIHSYVFVAHVEQGLNSILFNTERERNSWLLELDAKRLQSIFERIANDDVNSIEKTMGEDGEWKVVKASGTVNKSRKLPPSTRS